MFAIHFGTLVYYKPMMTLVDPNPNRNHSHLKCFLLQSLDCSNGRVK